MSNVSWKCVELDLMQGQLPQIIVVLGHAQRPTELLTSCGCISRQNWKDYPFLQANRSRVIAYELWQLKLLPRSSTCYDFVSLFALCPSLCPIFYSFDSQTLCPVIYDSLLTHTSVVLLLLRPYAGLRVFVPIYICLYFLQSSLSNYYLTCTHCTINLMISIKLHLKFYF